MKNVLTHNRNNLLSQRTLQTETKILPIATPFSDIGKLFTETTDKNWYTTANDITLSTIWPSKPLLAYNKSSGIQNHLVHSAQTYGSSSQDS